MIMVLGANNIIEAIFMMLGEWEKNLLWLKIKCGMGFLNIDHYDISLLDRNW